MDRFDLLDNAPCALHSLAADATILHVNSTWLRWLGYRREEVEGVMPLSQILTDDARESFARYFAGFIGGGPIDDLDLEIRRKDESTFCAQLSATAVYDEHGQFLLARCGFVDITARKRVEDRLRRLLDAAPDGMLVVDPSGRIDFANPQAERMFGYGRAELVGQQIEVLLPERYRMVHVGHRARFLQNARVRPMGLDLPLFGRHKDGTEFPIEISLSPHEVDALCVVAAIRDITDRRRIEAVARLASERLADAVESIDEAFAIFDSEGRLAMHNSAFRLLHNGAVRGPLTGLTIAELALALAVAEDFSLVQQAQFVAERVAMLANPHTVGVFERLGRLFHVVTRKTRDGGAVVILSDRTDERLREAELRKASAAKSEFLSSMSHELRTPLNAILGFAQLLQRDRKAPLSGRQIGMVEYILDGGEHLLLLIDEILDLARIEAGRMPISLESIGLAEVVQRVVTTLAPMASRSAIELIVAPEVAAVPKLIADRTRLLQILMNFGSNAIKYGKPGGKVTIAAAVVTHGVRILVIDDGVGIPLDRQKQVFEPFQRAGQEAGPIEGTGIGLTITQRLASLMSGAVGFRSVPGEGSRFWVDLPIAAEAAAVDHPVVRAAESPLARSNPIYSVVYVEDHPANIAFMQEVLAEIASIELITAPTAEIGVEIVRTRRPDVVILDINLPGMSGIDALQLLRSWPETADIPVLALSAASMERDIKRGIEAGFYRYLTKPVRVDELITTLEEVLVKSSPLSD